jgi:hypothetical protein
MNRPIPGPETLPLSKGCQADNAEPQLQSSAEMRASCVQEFGKRFWVKDEGIRRFARNWGQGNWRKLVPPIFWRAIDNNDSSPKSNRTKANSVLNDMAVVVKNGH